MPRREAAAVATIEEQRRPMATLPAGTPVAPPAAKVETITREVRTVLIEVPMGEPGAGYLSQHVEARMDARQALALKSLLAGLRDGRMEMASGREVRTAAEAVKWILEKLAAE
jgi:hypothetical protein